jgi:4-phospho-D-threonate 3-dehydrogenase / 4-phospho-D-erythronate 3-dehydrogenase
MKPTIAVAMGDPAGIGPELIIKVLTGGTVRDRCRPVVIGEARVVETTAASLGSDVRVRSIGSLAEVNDAPSGIDILRPPDLRLGSVAMGRIDPEMGEAAAACLRHAFALATAGEVDGVVSAPLNKQAFHLAGYRHVDELSWLAELTGSADPFIVGVMGSVWVVKVTEHLPLRDVADAVRKENVRRRIDQLDEVLRRVGVARPRIAVAALNPHGGEGGLFGREEIDEIGPAICEAETAGRTVAGPIPADSVFVRARAGEFDGVVCLYHDQANIARKLHATRDGVTLFMGLPVICATTAHGTAFDRAGTGTADPGSLVAAIEYASELARPSLPVG